MCPQSNLGPTYHIERGIAVRQGITEYPCACRQCHGGRSRSVSAVAKHHRQYGRDLYMRYLVLVSISNKSHGGMDRNVVFFFLRTKP